VIVECSPLIVLLQALSGAYHFLLLKGPRVRPPAPRFGLAASSPRFRRQALAGSQRRRGKRAITNEIHNESHFTKKVERNAGAASEPARRRPDHRASRGCLPPRHRRQRPV